MSSLCPAVQLDSLALPCSEQAALQGRRQLQWRPLEILPPEWETLLEIASTLPDSENRAVLREITDILRGVEREREEGRGKIMHTYLS